MTNQDMFGWQAEAPAPLSRKHLSANVGQALPPANF
jgi:hypothetical protein